MPALHKQGGVYWSDIRIGGVRVRKSLGRNRIIAKERLRDLVRQQHEARYGIAESDIPWGKFKTKYLEYCDGSKAPATAERDRAAISALEKFHKPQLLRDVTPELLERWKGHRKKEGRGHATINRDLRAVKTMMHKALEWGYLHKWSAKGVKKLRESKGRLLYYTPEEVKLLLGVCRSRFSAFYDWETICLLGVRAGLRRAEIYHLSWKDVDLGRGILSVVAKDGWQPKTGEQRHIPMPDDLTQHLVKKRRVLGNQEWVIGERPSLAVMSAFFQKISRKAKLPGNLHTLRHTFASHLVAAGVDLYAVSKLLGHASIVQTQRYAHLAPHTLKDAVSRLPSLGAF